MHLEIPGSEYVSTTNSYVDFKEAINSQLLLLPYGEKFGLANNHWDKIYCIMCLTSYIKFKLF